MSYTRLQLETAFMSELGMVRGMPGYDDPLSRQRVMNQEVDNLARGTGCYYVELATDIVSAQNEYCLPQLYRVKAVTVLDSGGTLHVIWPSTPAEFDARYGSFWRSNPTTGTPQFYLTEGDNRVKLYPIPDYGQTAGFVWEGYGMPGNTWSADTALFPLPDSAFDAAMYGCALRFANRNKKAYGDRVQDLTVSYKGLRGKLERETATLTDAKMDSGQTHTGSAYSRRYTA